MDTTRTDAPWIRAAKAWLKAKETSDKATLALEKKRWTLTKLADGASANGNGVCLTRFFRAGTIDYGKIPELAGVALDLYRKAGDWQMRVTKE